MELADVCTAFLSKLKRPWVGPFTIAKVVSPVAFRLDLPPGGRSIQLFMPTILRHTSAISNSDKRLSHHLLSLWMGIWNTRLRRFYSIGARVLNVNIWSLRNVTTFQRLPRSQNRISSMLQMFWQITCTV